MVLNAQLTHIHQLFSIHSQVRQGEERGQLSGVFHQPAKAYFHVPKLALGHPERMFDHGDFFRVSLS